MNMNNLVIKIVFLMTGSAFMSSCSDNNSFEDPNAGGEIANSGTISQKNMSILSSIVNPPIFQDTGVATDTTLTITVKIGDNKNQLLTDAHTVFFRTEWGLIEPSCITASGFCTVDWQTSFGSPAPEGNLNTITAYTLGEENFSDTNGNGVFDDADTAFPDGSGNLFEDRPEPFVDADLLGFFNTGDIIIDVIDDNNTLGTNGVHNDPDGFLNSPNCTHSSLCSTVRKTIFIWTDIEIDMNAPPTTP